MTNKYEKEKHVLEEMLNTLCINIEDNNLITKLRNLYKEWHSDENQERPDFIIGNDKTVGIEHCAVLMHLQVAKTLKNTIYIK